MTNLPQLVIEDGYRTNDAAILDDFYLPCLRCAVSYDRSVGYFNSGALALALRGISNLLENDGRIRIIASPALSAEDLEAIESGYNARSLIESTIVRTAAQIVNELPIEQRKLLRWLVANDRLDIRLALVRGRVPAIYHEKRGLFKDDAGNVVTFIGSANETAAALRKNFESIEVFRSWFASERGRTERHTQDFERLWHNQEPGLMVEAFPDAARHVILTQIAEGVADPAAFDEEGAKPPFSPLLVRTLHSYQKDAVRAWLGNGGRGLLQMATGTGKTITALFAARKIADDYRARSRPLAIIIVAPFMDLVVQWSGEAQNFGFDPILCFKSRQDWEAEARNAVVATNHGIQPTFVAITTNATFGGEAFQAAVTAITSDVLLIVDEVHNIGSGEARTLLTPRFKMRLGLSATPDRWFDDAGTAAIMDFFGGVVYSIGLKEAIDCGALTPYRYYVHPVRLSDEETLAFMELTDRIRKLAGYADIEDANGGGDELKKLLLRRARVVANASGKPTLLEHLVKKDNPQSHTLVYCGVGATATDDGTSVKVVDDITTRLNSAHLRAAPYTALTPSKTRAALQREFAFGSIQYLVAMRCLDEGIDMPSTRRAYFLASSTNPRQFVQRRGRILRRSPGKTVAEIHDMLTLLSEYVYGAPSYERSVLRRELQRVKTFAAIAENGEEAMGSLLGMVEDSTLLFES